MQGTERGTLKALAGLDQWQVYCHRGSAWSNCQSSNDVTQRAPQQNGQVPAPAPVKEMLPGAVRVVLTLSNESGFVGAVTRDVLLPPQPNP